MTPTPETLRNATPDNLAKLARLIAIRQPLNEEAVSEAIDLCVAAWVADRKRLEAAEYVRRHSRLLFVAKRVLTGALEDSDLRIAVDEHEALVAPALAGEE